MKLDSAPYLTSALGGLGCSPSAEVAHRRVAMRINDLHGQFGLILADKTLNRAQAAPLISKLHTNHAKAIQADLAKFNAELEVMAGNHMRKLDALYDSMSLRDAVMTFAALKGAMKPMELMEAINASPDIALAAARVPQALSGLTPEVAHKSLLAHYPDLVAAGEQLEIDQREYRSVEKKAGEMLRTVESAIDGDALATAYDVSGLQPAE